jgi:SAM-dependent methyltransferase
MSLRELYRVEKLPVLQNRIYEDRSNAIDCQKGDIVLVQDVRTGLIFNRAFDPELVKYDVDYQNEQALSPRFRQHLEEVEGIFEKHFRGDTLLEIGCGKGYFLEVLRSRGFAATGFDPSYEGDSPYIKKMYFAPGCGVSADGLVLRHVLEHVQEPLAFLESIRDANEGRGRVYIEVPCFDWICARRAWFDVFYEHVNYFRLEDFHRIFGTVYESGHLFGGQYMYVVADMASLRAPRLNEESHFQFPGDFADSLGRYQKLIRDYRASTGHGPIVWGASSKGVIFSLLMKRAGVDIAYMVDINPVKQGMYAPATGLEILSPEAVKRRLPSGSLVLVMNGNYLAEIKDMTDNSFIYVAIDDASPVG